MINAVKLLTLAVPNGAVVGGGLATTATVTGVPISISTAATAGSAAAKFVAEEVGIKQNSKKARRMVRLTPQFEIQEQRDEYEAQVLKVAVTIFKIYEAQFNSIASMTLD